MSGWNAKYKNDFGEYEITFYSKDYEKTKAVEKVCCAIMDGIVKNAADITLVRHGRWEIIKSNGLSELCRCSACGENDRHACYTTLPYCCHCGAKMAEEKIDLEDTE